MSKSKVELSSYEDFLHTIKKLNKTQLQSYLSDELFKLRNAFKAEEDVSFSSLVKIVYFYTIGFDVSFSRVGLIKYTASKKFVNKRIGYIALSVAMHSDCETLLLMTQSLLYDLQSSNTSVVSIALNTLLQIGDESMFRAAFPEIQKLFLSHKPLILKKALLCLDKIFTFDPDFAIEFIPQIKKFSSKILGKSESVSHGVLICLIHLYATIIKVSFAESVQLVTKQIPKLLKIFLDVHLTEQTFAEYGVIDTEDPFLQSIMLRFFTAVHREVKLKDESYLKPLETSYNNTFGKILGFHIQEIKKSNTLNTSPSISVMIEIAKLILSYADDTDMFELTFKILYNLFLLPNTNYRFVCMQIISNFIHNRKAENTSETLESLLLKALEDPNSSVRHQGLGLIYHLTNHSNAQNISTDLLEHMRTKGANKKTRTTLYDTILSLLTRFDMLPLDWKINILIEAMSLNPDIENSISTTLLSDYLCTLSTIPQKSEFLSNAISKLRLKLNSINNKESESLIIVALWSIGEFCTLLSLDNDLINDIDSIIQRTDNAQIQICALNVLMKLRGKIYSNDSQKKEQIELIFSKHSQAYNEEIQKRACEYNTMSKSILGPKLQSMFESMVGTVKNSSISFGTIPGHLETPTNLESPSSVNTDDSQPKMVDLFSVFPNIGTTNNSTTTNGSTPSMPPSTILADLFGPITTTNPQNNTINFYPNLNMNMNSSQPMSFMMPNNFPNMMNITEIFPHAS